MYCRTNLFSFSTAPFCQEQYASAKCLNLQTPATPVLLKRDRCPCVSTCLFFYYIYDPTYLTTIFFPLWI